MSQLKPRSTGAYVVLAAALLCGTPLAAQPTVSATSPAGGTGYSQTFSVSVVENSGISALDAVEAIISTNSDLSGFNSCLLLYDPRGHGFYLAADDNSRKGWDDGSSDANRPQTEALWPST